MKTEKARATRTIEALPTTPLSMKRPKMRLSPTMIVTADSRAKATATIQASGSRRSSAVTETRSISRKASTK